ncbi:3052_t:CDS:2 [Entrophospora sp. SA101]|nr:10705_t:CDS:2 [Entrophospora sp. SA101]CAJ0922246.1 3052_t:CDS:2 [Entrophospora sp. SA101]
MLKEKTRSQLTEELRKHWENNESEKKGKKNELEDTVEIMRLLEEEIIKYRQCHHHWANEKGDEVDDKCSNVQPEDIEKKALSELSSRCGGTGAYPRNYESPNGSKATFNHSSHCAKCGKYSNVYHYIYDKDTDKLTQSFDNASNPNKQNVCVGNVVKKDLVVISTKKVTKATFTKDFVPVSVINTTTLKIAISVAVKLPANLTIAIRQIELALYASGTAAEMDWHNPNVNDGKKFCSKSCCLSHYAEKCDTCSKKIGTGEKSYYQDAKKTKEKPVSSNSSANNRNDSPNQPSPTNNSPFSFNPPSEGTNSNGTSYLDCPFCQKRVYSEEECNQHLQDSLDCQKKQEIMKPIAEKIENNESILDVKVDDLGLNQEMTITLKAVQRIQRGEKVNIDQLNISEEAKKQLRNIKSLKDYRREESNSDPKKKF